MKRTSVVLLLVAIACGGADPVSLKPQLVVVLDVTGGANQADTVGRELAPVVMHARDEKTAAPIAGQLVNWVVVSGGGSVFAPATQTDTLGDTRQRWTLGYVPGDQVLEARAVDPTTGAPLTFARVHAMAIARPTLLTINAYAGPAIVTIHWRTGESITDTIPLQSQHCRPLPTVADSGSFEWSVNGTHYQGPMVALQASLGWTLTLAPAGSGWAGSGTCVP